MQRMEHRNRGELAGDLIAENEAINEGELVGCGSNKTLAGSYPSNGAGSGSL